MRRRGRTSETSVAAGERLVSRYSPQGSLAATSSRDVLPATYTRSEPSFAPEWLGAIARRIVELSFRPDGWDSYGAASLQQEAIVAAVDLLASYGSVMQTQPAVSLTSDGGLLFEWRNDESYLEYTASPDGWGHVYYADSSEREWDGPVTECILLEKWLWRASRKSED